MIRAVVYNLFGYEDNIWIDILFDVVGLAIS